MLATVQSKAVTDPVHKENLIIHGDNDNPLICGGLTGCSNSLCIIPPWYNNAGKHEV